MKKNVLKPIIVNNKNFKKIVLDFLYPCSYEENLTVTRFFLKRMLLSKTNSYPTEELFSNAKINNFIFDFSVFHFIRGGNIYFEFKVTIPDKRILQDESYSYEETIKFILDSIYNPYVKDNSFYEEDFINAKNELKMWLDEKENRIEDYSSLRMDEIMDDEQNYKGILYRHKDKIDSITIQDVYKFYESIIKNKRPIVFAIGNINDDFANILNNNLPDLSVIDKIDNNYIHPFLNMSQGIKEVEEKKDFSQSVLKVGYKVTDYKKEDSPLLSLVNFMLSSPSSKILYDYLRYQNPLCYLCNSLAYMNYGVLIINAQIHRDKKDIALEKIREIMEKLQDEAFVEKYLNNVKDRKRINLLRSLDSIDDVLDDYIVSFMEYCFPLDKEYEMIKSVTPKDVVNFVKRLKLDTIYYLEGTRDAK